MNVLLYYIMFVIHDNISSHIQIEVCWPLVVTRPLMPYDQFKCKWFKNLLFRFDFWLILTFFATWHLTSCALFRGCGCLQMQMSSFRKSSSCTHRSGTFSYWIFVNTNIKHKHKRKHKRKHKHKKHKYKRKCMSSSCKSPS